MKKIVFLIFVVIIGFLWIVYPQETHACHEANFIHRDHTFSGEGAFSIPKFKGAYASLGMAGPKPGPNPGSYDNIFFTDLVTPGRYRVQVNAEYEGQADEHIVIESSDGNEVTIPDLDDIGNGAEWLWGEEEVDMCEGGAGPPGSILIRAWSQIPWAVCSLPVREVRVTRIGDGGCIIPSSAPVAAISCDPADCTTWKGEGSLNPVLTLQNNSTDLNGLGDIVKSIWGGDLIPSIICSVAPILCDYTVQLSMPVGDWTAELTVEDSGGETSTAVETIHIKQDIIADFDCSLDDVTWEACETINPLEDTAVYFQDLSIESEGASIVDWTWTFEDGMPKKASTQNTSTKFKKLGPKDVILEVVDDSGRSAIKTKVVNSLIPFPEIREVSPF